MSCKTENYDGKNVCEESDDAMEDSDFDEDDSPSKFRANVKRFLEEQRCAKEKAKTLDLEEKRVDVRNEDKRLGNIEKINIVEIDDLIYDSDDDDDEMPLELDEVSCDQFEVSVDSIGDESKESTHENDNGNGGEILVHNPETLELDEVSSDVFETEQEPNLKDVPSEADKRRETRSSSRDIEVNKSIFSQEMEKIKSIPDPDDYKMSSQEFEKEIYFAFKRVLPRNVLSSVTSKKCGLCHEEFPRLKEAWKHYRGHNHIRAVKCHVKGTFKKHPPFFKMCLEAIADKESAVSLKEIYKFVTEKYAPSYSEERLNQLIIWGIERLVENKYVTDNGSRHFILDPALSNEIKSEGIMNLPSLEMASSARKERGAPRNFSIISFEKRIHELFRKDLPFQVLKTLKPNHCGVCHLVIREKNAWDHYEGHSHRRMVAKMGGRTSFSNRDISFRRSEISPRDKVYRERRESDRFYREREREIKRKNHWDERRSSHRISGEYYPSRERARDERRTPERRSPMRRRSFIRRSSSPKRRRSNLTSSPFTHRDSRKLPVFIDSTVGGKGPRALMIPKADPTDFTRGIGYSL